jgi:hypothetical protein
MHIPQIIPPFPLEKLNIHFPQRENLAGKRRVGDFDLLKDRDIINPSRNSWVQDFSLVYS